MTLEEKKRDEFRLLRCVYDVDGFESVTPSERPDFIIRPGGTRGLFGVEVTEVYQSESDARLDRLPGYAAQLFAGGEPRHKDDYAALSLDTVSILEPDGTVKEADIPAIVRDMPTVDEYRTRIIAAIEVKGTKRVNYSPTPDFVNLLIRDNICLLAGNKREDFSRLVMNDELKFSAANSGFREVFVVTRIDSSEVFVPLVPLCLLSEYYMFGKAAMECDPNNELAAPVDLLTVFAHFLRMRGFAPNCRRFEDGTEVFLGGTGIVASKERGPVLHLYDGHPLPACSPPLPLCQDDERVLSAVLRSHEQLHQDMVFTSPLVFDVRESINS